jgi:hypothetical protein
VSVAWRVGHARSGVDSIAASDSGGRRRRVVGMRAAKARRGRVGSHVVTARRQAGPVRREGD